MLFPISSSFARPPSFGRSHLSSASATPSQRISYEKDELFKSFHQAFHLEEAGHWAICISEQTHIYIRLSCKELMQAWGTAHPALMIKG